MSLTKFLFGNTKFSAFNNEHFLVLFCVSIIFVIRTALYYLGRFYAFNNEFLGEYFHLARCPNDWECRDLIHLIPWCKEGGNFSCIFLSIKHTILITMDITKTSVLFFWNYLLAYLFFAYVFYFALPGIRDHYHRFQEAEKKCVERKDCPCGR